MPGVKARRITRGSYKRSLKGSELPFYRKKKSCFEVKEKYEYWFQTDADGNHCSSFDWLCCFYQLKISHSCFESHTVVQMEWWNEAKFICISWKVYSKQEHSVTLGCGKIWRFMGYQRDCTLSSFVFATETTEFVFGGGRKGGPKTAKPHKK